MRECVKVGREIYQRHWFVTGQSLSWSPCLCSVRQRKACVWCNHFQAWIAIDSFLKPTRHSFLGIPRNTLHSLPIFSTKHENEEQLIYPDLCDSECSYSLELHRNWCFNLSRESVLIVFVLECEQNAINWFALIVSSQKKSIFSVDCILNWCHTPDMVQSANELFEAPWKKRS